MTSSARSEAPAPASSRDDDRRAAPDDRQVANFERALRQRSRPQDKDQQRGGDGSDAEDTAAPGDAALASMPPLGGLPLPFALALSQAQAQAQAMDIAPPTRGLVEPPPAALGGELTTPAEAMGTADAARAFEVSLREPLGAGVTLHAVAPAGGARWTLALGAQGLNPQELRRNLGRLEERLRAKGLSHEPLDLLEQPDASDHHEELP
jgi:hypothetical protein